MKQPTEAFAAMIKDEVAHGSTLLGIVEQACIDANNELANVVKLNLTIDEASSLNGIILSIRQCLQDATIAYNNIMNFKEQSMCSTTFSAIRGAVGIILNEYSQIMHNARIIENVKEAHTTNETSQ